MGRKEKMLLLLLCLALLISACGGQQAGGAGEPVVETTPTLTPTPSPDSVFTIWLAEDLPLCDDLAALAEDYAAQFPAHAPTVRRFASAEQMMAALEGETPDLALCTERETAVLLAEGRLGMLSFPDEPEPLFRSAPGVAESGFFPLGADLPVLAVQRDQLALLDGCDTMEALCETAASYAAENERPFFSADSFSRIFACLMAQKGSEFMAQRTLDAKNESFREVYNLLADCAWEGGLIAAEGAVTDLVESGELVCAVCGSASLAGRESGMLAIQPLPPLEGCDALVETRVCGLAALPDADSEKAERFLGWLYADGRASLAAIGQGLVPAIGGDEPAASELMSVSRSSKAFFLPADSAYFLHGGQFDREFSAALALLG